jgi:hypothetical protein
MFVSIALQRRRLGFQTGILENERDFFQKKYFIQTIAKTLFREAGVAINFLEIMDHFFLM